MRWLWCEDNRRLSAASNMELDAALLQRQCASRAFPIVRVYTWEKPAVTAGRLQSIESVRRAYPDLEVIGRPTGGRAVVHGGDLTVTVSVREEALGPERHRVRESFRWITDAVRLAFCEFGTPCVFAEGSRPADNRVDCFAHSANCDLVDASGIKIAGCAQRRMNGAILQQMSLPGLAGRPEFRVILRDAMTAAYGVGEWIFVDTQMALCYTEPNCPVR